MRLIARTLAVWGLLTPLLVAALAGQKPPKPIKPQRPHRTGLWAEFGGGAGSVRVACSTCDDVITEGGVAGLTRIGGVISDNVLLGFESAVFTDETFVFAESDSATIAEMESAGIVVLWFPGRSGLFLKGGVSVAQGRFTVPSGAQVDSVSGTGIGMTFGLGWDWSFSRKYALTLNAAAFVTAIGDLVLPSSRVDDVIGTVYQLTLSFTFR